MQFPIHGSGSNLFIILRSSCWYVARGVTDISEESNAWGYQPLRWSTLVIDHCDTNLIVNQHCIIILGSKLPRCVRVGWTLVFPSIQLSHLAANWGVPTEWEERCTIVSKSQSDRCKFSHHCKIEMRYNLAIWAKSTGSRLALALR